VGRALGGNVAMSAADAHIGSVQVFQTAESTLSGLPGDEPIQINVGSLRSLSSQSLSRMGEDAEAAEKAAQMSALQALNLAPGALGSAGSDGSQWTVKNTFLDFEGGRPPLPSRLRPVFSAAGRLDQLAEESSIPPLGLLPEASNVRFVRQDGEVATVQEAVATRTVPAKTEKRSQDTPLMKAAARSGALDAGARPFGPGSSLPLADGRGSELRVKNTFLDFAEEAPPTMRPLRVVQTAAGRLDLLGQE